MALDYGVRYVLHDEDVPGTQYGFHGIPLKANVLPLPTAQGHLWTLQACCATHRQSEWIRLVYGKTEHSIFLISFLLFLKNGLHWATQPSEIPTQCT